jgi:hypothetical protein
MHCVSNWGWLGLFPASLCLLILYTMFPSRKLQITAAFVLCKSGKLFYRTASLHCHFHLLYRPCTDLPTASAAAVCVSSCPYETVTTVKGAKSVEECGEWTASHSHSLANKQCYCGHLDQLLTPTSSLCNQPSNTALPARLSPCVSATTARLQHSPYPLADFLVRAVAVAAVAAAASPLPQLCPLATTPPRCRMSPPTWLRAAAAPSVRAGSCFLTPAPPPAQSAAPTSSQHLGTWTRTPRWPTDHSQGRHQHPAVSVAAAAQCFAGSTCFWLLLLLLCPVDLALCVHSTAGLVMFAV